MAVVGIRAHPRSPVLTRPFRTRKSWVDWDMELIMRDTPNRERVKLVNVLDDGRVQVIGQEDGIQRTLVSDYFL